ncbi:MAG: tyrosine-type recombinase/integrase [Stenotrophomonas rhizophila]|uniref:tyrosine-type recombinase/integrase n=1 Tax=Stenotrophomonas rhizophila TaxID=216778 RepID=UPI003D0C261C
MRVLIACEYSGAVRDQFITGGHEAMSCDLLPTDAPGPHYEGDVRDVLGYPWDLMIAHPPCTHLSVSGARHFEAKRRDGRQQSAVSFFMMLAKADIPMIAIENPPSFHEIRSLGCALLNGSGWKIEQVQALMGHSSVAMTEHYLDGHDTPWLDVQTGTVLLRRLIDHDL